MDGFPFLRDTSGIYKSTPSTSSCTFQQESVKKSYSVTLLNCLVDTQQGYGPSMQRTRHYLHISLVHTLNLGASVVWTLQVFRKEG